MDFIIRINDKQKDIHVSNVFQEDLGDLVKMIVMLLKKDYIGYNENTVPWKE
jgi:hypothetical protein